MSTANHIIAAQDFRIGSKKWNISIESEENHCFQQLSEEWWEKKVFEFLKSFDLGMRLTVQQINKKLSQILLASIVQKNKLM